MFEITDAAAAILDSQFVVREIDRGGHPHLLVKVPDIDKVPEAEIGLEVSRGEDGGIVLSLLIYDIPTEPVSYEIRFAPSVEADLKFLRALIKASQFRMHPCAREERRWKVGKQQTFRIPPNVLLRLKHHSLEWPMNEGGASTPPAPEPPRVSIVAANAPPAPDTSGVDLADQPPMARSGQPDPRDTVIKKLKEQNHLLRDQLRAKDKRIIELEDELNEIKSKGRAFKLNEKKSWWNPF